MNMIASCFDPTATSSPVPRLRPLRTCAWTWGLATHARRLARANAQLERYQRQLLHAWLRQHAATAYGRAHGLGRIDSVAAFQAKVPIVTREALAPWLKSRAAGGVDVLALGPTLLPAPAQEAVDGGATPTATTAELAAAWGPFVHSWLRLEPQLQGRRLFVDPYLPQRGDLRALLGGRAGTHLQAQALPAAFDLRRLTVQLLQEGDLGGMVWQSPTALWAVVELLRHDLDALLTELDPRRAATLAAALARTGACRAHALWPQMRQVALPHGGAMAVLAAALQPFLAGIQVGEAPLGGAEAVLTAPQWGSLGDPKLAAASHFFEFLPLEAHRGPPLLAHRLRSGAAYVPVVTTAAGLCRYRLNFAVQCTGHADEVPTLRYLDTVAPLGAGGHPPLSGAQVQQALERAAARKRLPLRFAMCAAPAAAAPTTGYVLYLETDADAKAVADFGAAVEAQLCNLHTYCSARHRQLLPALRIQRVSDGWQRLRPDRGRALPTSLVAAIRG